MKERAAARERYAPERINNYEQRKLEHMENEWPKPEESRLKMENIQSFYKELT